MNRKATCTICLVLFLFASKIKAQITTVNFFGHLGNKTTNQKGEALNSFELGSQNLFLTSVINPKISFTGELLVRHNNITSFNANIQRAYLNFNYLPNHAVIFGKVNTPVNY